MGGVQIGEQKADRASLHAVGHRRVDGVGDGFGGRRLEHRAIGHDPLGQFHPAFPRHQGAGKISLQIVAVGADLAADFQQVAEPLGGNQADDATATLQQRIGGDGRPVLQPLDLGQLGAAGGEHGLQPLDHGDCRVCRGRWGLVDEVLARIAAKGKKIRKRAPDVDADNPAHERNPPLPAQRRRVPHCRRFGTAGKGGAAGHLHVWRRVGLGEHRFGSSTLKG